MPRLAALTPIQGLFLVASPCTATNMSDAIVVDSGVVICGLVVAAARCTRKLFSFEYVFDDSKVRSTFGDLVPCENDASSFFYH